MISNQDIFEKEHVIDVYEKISKHFDHTRYHCWPRVRQYINSFYSGAHVADVGCGNGRNCLERDDVNYMGYEIVETFIQICKNKNIPVTKSNILDIQCKSNIYDNTLCIAVLHHLSTNERRIQAIKELIRITKCGGSILIYVWAKEQDKYSSSKSNDVMIKWTLFGHYNSDKKTQILNRYYHLFSKGELENLIYTSGIDDVEIIETGTQRNNHYVLLKKTER